MSQARQCDGCQKVEADENKAALWLYFAWRKKPRQESMLFGSILGDKDDDVIRWEFCTLRCAASRLFALDVEEQWTK